MNTVMAAMLDWLLPAYCELCGLHSGAAALCATCAADLPRIEQPCPGCGLPTPAPQLPCGRCVRHPPPWDACRVPLVYAGTVRTLVLRLKRDASPGLLAALVQASGRPPASLPAVDAVVPIPSTRWRNLRRGFNPAELVARQLAHCFEIGQVDSHLLVRRHGPQQAGLGRAQRARNVRGVFAVRGTPPPRVLLVDDVLTSGATLGEATRTLRTAGARWVGVLALARAFD